MFRDMRRKDLQTSKERAYEIVANSEFGYLTMHGDDGYPYAIGINHVLVGESLYFHAASIGKKIDSIRLNNKVSFSCVLNHLIVPEKLTTKYASAICMGKAFMIEGDEKRDALMMITKRFAAAFLDKGVKDIEAMFDKTAIIRMDIEHITGKEKK